MSDMIDSLHKAALEAGAASAPDLVAPETVAVLHGRVRAGVRKRRIRTAVAAVGAMAAIGVAGVQLPALFAEVPMVEPAEDPVVPVSTIGNLTVFSDGSMSVVTQRGSFVDIPAPEPADAQPFVPFSADQMCAFDADQVVMGWSFTSEEARLLLRFAQPQVLEDGIARRMTVNGEMLPLNKAEDFTPVAITINTEPAAAEHLGIRQTVYTVWRDAHGTPIVLHHAGALDALPKVRVDGDTSAGTALGRVEGRKTAYTGYCGDKYPELVPEKHAEPYVVQRYLVADIFLIDRNGNSLMLGSHTSWTTTEISE